MRERELIAQPGELLALALALIQRRAQPGAQRRVAGPLAAGRARRSGALSGAQPLDLGAQLAVLVEKRAADPRALRDGGERDRGDFAIELTQRRANALLGRERPARRSVGEWTAGWLRRTSGGIPLVGGGEVAQLEPLTLGVVGLDRVQPRENPAQALLVALEHLHQPQVVVLARAGEQPARLGLAAARARRETSRR